MYTLTNTHTHIYIQTYSCKHVPVKTARHPLSFSQIHVCIEYRYWWVRLPPSVWKAALSRRRRGRRRGVVTEGGEATEGGVASERGVAGSLLSWLPPLGHVTLRVRTFSKFSGKRQAQGPNKSPFNFFLFETSK